MNSPALISSSTEIVTCATTSPLRSRTPPDPPTTAPTWSFSVGARFGLVDRSAGTSPNSEPGGQRQREVEERARGSRSSPEITCGVSVVGRNPSRNRVVHDAMTSPSSPPTAASSTLSTSSCPTMRPRLAPRARRTAISFWRAVARAISRLATLAHAISSTPATMPSSSQSGCDSCWRIGERPCAAGSRSTCPFRNCSRVYAVVFAERRRRALPARGWPWKYGCRAAFACSSVTPGFSRAEYVHPAAAPVVDVVPVRRHLPLSSAPARACSARSRCRRRRSRPATRR